MRSHIVILFFLLISLLHHQHSLAQSTAPPPDPPGPTNITRILEKAGQFTALIRLLKSTQLGDQINTHLNNSHQEITIFAPTDNAFSSLKSGTLNSLTNQQQVELVQFHVIPIFLSMSQFQTVSNPVRTQAGDSSPGLFPLNITTSGTHTVNISTGVNNATVSNTIYTDYQLGVYQVDTVLLPQKIFDPLPPAPAQAPAPGSVRRSPAAAGSPGSDGGASVDVSGAAGYVGVYGMVASSMGVAAVALFVL